jgi:hypothetical protein
MSATTQSSNGSTNATTSPLDRAKRLALTLLSERGEASGALLARELHGVLRTLDAARGTASSAISRPNFSPTQRHCVSRRNATSPIPRLKPRPPSRRPPIRPGRNCCGG